MGQQKTPFFFPGKQKTFSACVFRTHCLAFHQNACEATPQLTWVCRSFSFLWYDLLIFSVIVLHVSGTMTIISAFQHFWCWTPSFVLLQDTHGMIFSAGGTTLVPSYIAPSLLFSKVTRTARTYPATWKMLRCRWCQIQITHVCYYICFLTLASKWHAFQKIYLHHTCEAAMRSARTSTMHLSSNEYSVFASVHFEQEYIGIAFKI